MNQHPLSPTRQQGRDVNPNVSPKRQQERDMTSSRGLHVSPLLARRALFGCLLLLAFPAATFAQEDEEPPPLQVTEVRAGYASYNPLDGKPRMKVGMWTPVYVKLKAGKKGFPEKKGDPPPQIQVETTDSEDVGTIYTIDTRTLAPNESETFTAYTRTGNLTAEIRVKVLFKGRLVEEKYPSSRAPSIGSLLVLTAGGTVSGLQDTLDTMNMNARKDFGPGAHEASKFAAQEGSARLLPELALGYDCVDLIILCTSNKKFLKDLAADRERVKAVSRYVRNGGHLVIGVAHDTQDLLHDLLSSEGWQPPLPVKPPRSAGDAKRRTFAQLGQLMVWGRTDKLFPPEPAVFAGLDPGRVRPGLWDVLVKEDETPIVTRMPYGLGRITFLAFPLDDTPFKGWAGKQDFLKALLARSVAQEAGIIAEGGRGNDVAGNLQRAMDQFDAQNVPFGLVALFIIVYILIVGPLDYFILKYVFKKLEWTWFTFPAVVLIVSIAAYYTAYSIRGNDQRINQVEIVDFDLRTDLDENGKTRKTYIYGQSFMTVLNPRIQAYTVGLEPNRAFFNLPAGKEALAAQPVTWFGRPSEEAWGMERAGSSSVLGKKSQPYRYAAEAAGVEKVPVPVWTTKSFRATYEAVLEKPPFEVDLTYPLKKGRPEDRDVVLRGTFKNHLPVDLMDVWFVYGVRFYNLTQPIPAKGELKILLESHHSKDVTVWRDAGDAAGVAAAPVGDTGVRAAPTSIVKSILFHDKAVFGTAQNHLLRTLDQSWRLEERPPLEAGDVSLREVIVYARLKQRQGKTEELAQATGQPLPSRLWIGALPGDGATRPEVLGSMTHDTYVRIILPVYAAER